MRPAGEEDVETLARILAEPEVARWWGRYDADKVRRDMAESPCLAIVIGGAVQGWLQVWEENDPEYRHVALDIGLATEVHGQGYGPEALRVAIRHYIERGHHRFTIDPARSNDRAIRAYSSVGFKPVGVMREYERLDGSSEWRDGLLMELLASEFEG